MATALHGEIDRKGRILIPVLVREALGLQEGTRVDFEILNHGLQISTIQSRILRAQERARKYVIPGTLVSDELIADRREAAKHE